MIPKEPLLADHNERECPIFTTLSLLANKWAISLLHQLLLAEDQTLRFTHLKRALTGITQRELTRQLRLFEASGIVARRVTPSSPPRVDYALTDLGRSLCAPIRALADWAERHGAEVQSKRADFAVKMDEAAGA